MSETLPRQPKAIASDDGLAQFIAQAAAGDRMAFAALYKRTEAKLYGVISLILSRSDLTADALQEAYVRIWQKAGSFDSDKGSPIAWMATIARNVALNEVYRAKRLALENMPDNFEPVAGEFDPLETRHRSERLAALLLCLSQLDAQKREMIMLAYYRGASREALSNRFERPIPTIKTLLRRSLSQLKKCLSS